jgi:hypothetical protein
MACNPDAPCGNVLRPVLRLEELTLYECLNAHSYVVRAVRAGHRECPGAPDPVRRPRRRRTRARQA